MAKTLKSIDELMADLNAGKVQVIQVPKKEIQPVHFQELVQLAHDAKDQTGTAIYWMRVSRLGLSLEQGMDILKGVERLNGR